MWIERLCWMALLCLQVLLLGFSSCGGSGDDTDDDPTSDPSPSPTDGSATPSPTDDPATSSPTGDPATPSPTGDPATPTSEVDPTTPTATPGTEAPVDLDHDGSSPPEDCDDLDPKVYPGAKEICDGRDNDCDGTIDDGLTTTTLYPDNDADGYGSNQGAITGCSSRPGYSKTGGDCDDTDPAIHPGAAEVCDTRDNDCDGMVDENLTSYTWTIDADGDGYGSGKDPVKGCSGPPGYAKIAGDCDDTDPAVHPGALEVCNGKNDDCDGEIDEGLTSSAYVDQDGDGYGAASSAPVATCSPVPGYAPNDLDCDDARPEVYFGALEVCNDVDEDCDGTLDAYLRRYHPDEDGDGFGAGDRLGCDPGAGFVQARGDCDDDDPGIYPGAMDGEADGVDQDCGGTAGPDPHVGLSATSRAGLQAAIDAATDGQTVWVGPGTWLEHDVRFDGRALRLISTRYALETVVDAQAQGRVMTFASGEGPDSIVDGLTLTGGLAREADGGGVFVEGADPGFVGCVITGNESWPYANADKNIAVGGRGGGLFFSDSMARLEGCRIEGNVALMDISFDNTGGFSVLTAGGRGGGIAAQGSSLTLQDCAVASNLATELGGGVYASGSTLSISGSDIVDNEATGAAAMYYDNYYYYPGYGGGLFQDGGSLEAADTAVTQNRADRGGGLRLSDATTTLTRCHVARNVVYDQTEGGGGLYLSRGSTRLLTCLIEGNRSEYGTRGGGLRVAGALRMEGCVVSGSGGNGIDIASGSQQVSLTGCIIAYNLPYNLLAAETPPTIAWSDLFNPPGSSNTNLSSLGADNLEVEPGFLRYDTAGAPVDFHLSAASALIDRGDPEAIDVDGSRRDPGIYGGPDGTGWDRDRDGAFDWFWPGTIEDTPEGFDPADYDCDDLDPTVPMVTSCTNWSGLW